MMARTQGVCRLLGATVDYPDGSKDRVQLQPVVSPQVRQT